MAISRNQQIASIIASKGGKTPVLGGVANVGIKPLTDAIKQKKAKSA